MHDFIKYFIKTNIIQNPIFKYLCIKCKNTFFLPILYFFALYRYNFISNVLRDLHFRFNSGFQINNINQILGTV